MWPVPANSLSELAGFIDMESSQSVRGAQAGFGERHVWIEAGERDALPWKIHGMGIGQANRSDCACFPQRIPTLLEGLRMRGQRTGYARGNAAEVDRDFPFQIDAGEVVIVFLRYIEPIADEHRGSLQIASRIRVQAGYDVVTHLKRLDCAVGIHERGGRFIVDDLAHLEFNGLIVSIGSGRIQAVFFELSGDIRGGLAVALAAGVTALELVAGQILNVRPPELSFGLVIDRAKAKRDCAGRRRNTCCSHQNRIAIIIDSRVHPAALRQSRFVRP